MKLIFITHQRVVSEKTHSPLIMKTCEGFAKLGLEVELWMPWRHNPVFRREDPFKYHHIQHNFAIKRLPAIDLFWILSGKLPFYLLVASFNLSLFFYKLIRRIPGDAIFYLHDIRDALALVFFKNPIFVEIHDYYQSGFTAVNRWTIKKFTGFISTNQIKMERLNKAFGIPYERMLHQPNAVDVEMFSINVSKEEARKKLHLPLDKKIILYTGHLYDWKGVDTLLEAAKYLTENERVYFVGGTDEGIQKFKVKSETLKAANVVIVGRKLQQEIPLWLKAADVLILPNSGKSEASKYETSPVKLFEYMASGRPIVASDLPSIREIVDERMVWFFEPDSPDDLAKTIMRVLNNDTEAVRKASAARKEAAKYTWDKRAKNITRFLLSHTHIPKIPLMNYR